MLPGNNAHGSPVACCRSSPVFKPLPGDLPVAQPGCPMDHFQTLVNRSPGDLWLRMYRHLLSRFSDYLALEEEDGRGSRAGKKRVEGYDWIRRELPGEKSIPGDP